MKKTYFLILFSFLIFFSCKKDIDELIITVNEDPPVVLVKSSVRGKVLDEDGYPMAGVDVTVENELLQTDQNGCFHFEKIEVKKSGTIVKAAIDGYFKGSAHSNFTADGSSFVEIRMMRKGFPQTIESADGGTVSTNDGMRIKISSGDIINANGNPYNGSINVYSRWLDPSDSEVVGIMPGALTATDEDGNPQALATYGMMVMELESEDGSALEIGPDKKVQVEMPIPANLLDDAPEEIPLWYFDLEEEQWLLAGACQLDGNYYICNITSTGYWNCDVALPAICLSGQVFNSDSTFACYLKVIVEDLTNNFIYWGYTDSIGYFCGSVPQAAPLRIYIKDLCDSIVYTADIGPFADDTDLDDIYLMDVVQQFIINITGTMMHCLSNDVPSGHLAVRYPGKIRIFPFDAGGFDVNLALKCVQFPDLNMRSYSASQPNTTIEINHSDISDVDLGLEKTCEDLPDYFNINVDGMEYWTSPSRYFLKHNTTEDWMVLEGLSGAGKFQLDIRDYQGPAIYNINVFFNTENDIPLPAYPVLNTASPNISLEITDEDGEYISGLFSGTATDINGMTRNITADFKIRKAP